jgi:MFS family permease
MPLSRSIRALIQDRSVHNGSLAFGLLATVQVTLILAITVLAIGLPAVARDLSLRSGELALVSAGYGLAFSALLLPGGRLADRLGPRRAFLVGVAVLGVASVGVATAGGFASALAARLGQGAGAALTAPAAVALLRVLYPDPDAYGRVTARWGTLAPIGATAGIVVSGLVAAADAWRAGLLIPAAVAGVALATGARLLPAPAPTPSTTIDIPGAVLVAVGATTLSYGLTTAGDRGWSAPYALVALAVAVAALAGFLVVEARSRAPLVPPSFVRSAGRALALGAVLLAAAAHASTGFFLALYFQQVRGRSALATTAAFLPLLLVLPLAGAGAARLLRVVRPLPLVAAGLAVSAAGLCAVGRLGPDTPYVGPLLLGLLILPVGVALTFAAAAVVAGQGVDRAQAGLAGALLNTAIELGPALGLAGLVAVASTRTTQLAARGQPPLVAQTGGYALAFTVAALALAGAALGVAVALRRVHPSGASDVPPTRTPSGVPSTGEPSGGTPDVPTTDPSGVPPEVPTRKGIEP